MKTSALATLLFAAPTVLAVDPIVQLPYATYQGASTGQVTQWLGMRYAAPPTGSFRFSEPQPPLPEKGVVSATQHGPVCLGVNSGTPAGYSEDCLYIDVYAPSSATPSSKLPVFLWIQGGGWATNSVPNVNGTDFVRASGNNVITAFINYRVGAFGFLGGQQFANHTSGTALNNGMRDQIAALAWIRDHIASFGGDPGKVTVGGSSAGAGSVMQLLTAYGGANDTLNGLFHAVAAESPFQPTLFSASASQFMYDDLVNATGCASSSDAATIACLRNLSAPQLQAANADYPLPGAPSGPANFEYGPTWDTKLWPDDPYLLFAKGRFRAVPAIFGDDANGGSIFTPKTLQDQPSFDAFMRNNFPALSPADLSTIHGLYTPANVAPLAPPGAAGFGAYYPVGAAAYGDATFGCAAQGASDALSSRGLPVYGYLFNASTAGEKAAGIGASHVSEQSAIFGNDAGVSSYVFDPALVRDVTGYWTSFVRSVGDVNAFRAGGAPVWPAWTAGKRTWIEFEDGSAHVAVVGAPSSLAVQRCAFWEAIGARLGQ